MFFESVPLSRKPNHCCTKWFVELYFYDFFYHSATLECLEREEGRKVEGEVRLVCAYRREEEVCRVRKGTLLFVYLPRNFTSPLDPCRNRVLATTPYT